MNTLLYKNKYRIPSARARWWDYAANARYFVTICTHNRAWYFGEVVDGVMRLSEIGEIAQACWMEIPQHFPFVQLDAFVVMPNHVHGIISIDKPEVGDDNVDNARLIDPGFAWQSLYHDHIIRNDKSYLNISEYIINNPAKWKEDKWYLK